ncbi:ribbon-helix-helix domain-containing protein [Agathobaculum sp.]|uniref:ribbon-helix-helix domain-containing protein n=1 Tax=Agathobaculum sp. TaxID=2048138 RepID=UPI0027BA1A9D|nr:ribbon-helix-helix domain-containing protein [Agathobaculum sp.]
MSTDRPRYTVSVDDEMFEQIENFRFENRYKTRSQATVELIRLGIEQLTQQNSSLLEPSKSESTLSPDELQLVEDYRSLNKQGQEYIRQTMYMAKQTYKKMPDLSDVEKQA